MSGIAEARKRFYRKALLLMRESGVPFLLGGAHALKLMTGIFRDTRDLDVFLKPEDCRRLLGFMSRAGFEARMAVPHWLAKIRWRGELIDVIFNGGNGMCPVDDGWFKHALEATVFGVKVAITPPEEMIWMKAFVMERNRFDGADIAHILRERGGTLDWNRLLERFGEHWPVLLSHLILFVYSYPSERGVPEWVLEELVGRLGRQRAAAKKVCRGTMLASLQYLVDVQDWGYRDARLAPSGAMSPRQIALWTRHLLSPEDARAH